MAITIDLAGRTVLVTGGTRGVGLGVTRAFRDAGAQVIACARHKPDTLPDGVRFAALDIRDPGQVAEVINGPLDLVVNNAGGAPYAPVAGTSPRLHAKVIELNLTAQLYVAQAAHRAMAARGGQIIMISSESAHRASPGTAAYGAAKAGLENLTRSLAVEWAPDVRVNAITVGPVRTESAHLHYGDEAGVEAVARTIAAGRLAEPYDVGAACVLLASPLAEYVNGAALLLDGGGPRPAFLDAATANKTANKEPQ